MSPEVQLRAYFWVKGYYVSTVGLNEASIIKYIREQENAERIIDKVSVKEMEDSFIGSELQCEKVVSAFLGAASKRSL